MLDRRFPYLQRVTDAAGLSDTERVRASKIADRVCSRTMTMAAWNAQTHSLYFYYRGDPTCGAYSFPFMIERNGVFPVSEADIEDMVKLIRMGQMPRDEKDEIAEQNKAKEEYEKAKAQQRFEDDVRPGAQDYADFRLRERRGVAKVITA